MLVIHTRNVHSALPEGLFQLGHHGIARESRNGPVVVFPEPVTTVYERPTERVMFWPSRDANPFFHLFEALWMIAGRDDVAFPASFVKNMRTFSDDGKRLHGAYGKRWRDWFHPADGVDGGADQLAVVAAILKGNPQDRRCVVQMWDATADLGRQGKDFPCNTQVIFSRNAEGELDMSVFNRSNDMIWGAYGANAVHFSFLQEFMAAWIGCPVGRYWQVSNNLHAYSNEVLDKVRHLSTVGDDSTDPYRSGQVSPYPLVSTDIVTWQQDLGILLEQGPITGFRDPFFRRVATPMWYAHAVSKDKTLDPEDRYLKALEIIEQCRATDWRLACQQWLQRRLDNVRAVQEGHLNAAE